MHHERRCVHRYAFVAHAEVLDFFSERVGRVKDLSIAGAYLAMRNPFSKGAPVVVKIRTETEYFECNATVAHSSPGIGMGVEFGDINPPFRLILQSWLSGIDLHNLNVIDRS
jgi:hypothetical protein